MDNSASAATSKRLAQAQVALPLALLATCLALCATLAAPAPQAHAATTDLGLVQSDATSSTATFTWDTPDSSEYSAQVIGYRLSTDSSLTYVDVSITDTSYTVETGDAEYCYLYVYLGSSSITAAKSASGYDVYAYAKGYPFDSSKLAKVKATSSSWTNSRTLYVNTDFNEKSGGTQIVVYSKTGKKLATVTKTSATTVGLDAAIGKVVKVRQRSYLKLSSGKTLYSTWSGWATFVPSCKVNSVSKASGKLKLKFKKTSGATKYIVRYAYSKKHLNSSNTKKLNKLKWKTKSVSKSKNYVKLDRKRAASTSTSRC